MNATGGGRVQGTRDAMLGILRLRSGVLVDELARALGLAGATVRRHLEVLRRDGYVSVEQVRGRTGRPRHAFSLTEEGAELFPHHYVRQTHRLLEEIVALSVDDTAGRDGAALADLVFDKMSARLAEEYAPRISGTTTEERARSAAALLADEGLDFEVACDDGVVRLLGRGCPCLRFAGDGHALACDHDRRLLEQVVGSAVVALPPDELPSEFLCGYRVEPGAVT